MTFMVFIWLVAIVVFGVMEATTVNLVSVWFAGGAIGAFFAALFGGNIYVQFVVFLIISVGLLLSLRPVMKHKILGKHTPTNADKIIGKVGIVTHKIDTQQGEGAVKVDGLIWTARTQDNAVIAVGSPVRILEIKGVKIYVESALDVDIKNKGE